MADDLVYQAPLHTATRREAKGPERVRGPRALGIIRFGLRVLTPLQILKTGGAWPHSYPPSVQVGMTCQPRMSCLFLMNATDASLESGRK